jgi:hypothetical protein
MEKILPVFGFTLNHLNGDYQANNKEQLSKVRLIEIEYNATGLKAFYLLASAKKIASDLKAQDMHVAFIAGKLVYRVMTGLNYSMAEAIAKTYGSAFSSETLVDEKGKNLKHWNDEELKYELVYKKSVATQKLVKGISSNKYWSRDHNIE